MLSLGDDSGDSTLMEGKSVELLAEDSVGKNSASGGSVEEESSGEGSSICCLAQQLVVALCRYRCGR